MQRQGVIKARVSQSRNLFGEMPTYSQEVHTHPANIPLIEIVENWKVSDIFDYRLCANGGLLAEDINGEVARVFIKKRFFIWMGCVRRRAFRG